MFKRPAQQTAATFLSPQHHGIHSLFLVAAVFPLLVLLAVAVKVGIVLGIHFMIEYLTGSWVALYFFAILTGAFTLYGFFSRVVELGRYYTGLGKYVTSYGLRAWYSVVFAVDFILTDMIMLTASALLAFVYWNCAVLMTYEFFYTYFEPFVGLSILGGLLQVLFSAYYLSHPQLKEVYAFATHKEHHSPEDARKQKKLRR